MVVVGAGIVGIATALYLQQDGHDVTVIDPHPPGEGGASAGNAGVVAVSHVVPVGMPGVLAQIPRMLREPLSPLSIRWSYLPRLLPWLYHFVRASTPSRVEQISIALADLLSRSRDAHQHLLKHADALDMLRPAGWVAVYRRRETFEADRYAHDLRRRRNVRSEVLGGSELRQLAPALSREYTTGVLFVAAAHVLDPLRLVKRLADCLLRDGGTISRARVTGIIDHGQAVTRLRTSAGLVDCDGLVIAAGAWSKSLLRMLGLNPPLDTERGYHVMIPNPGVELRVPLIAAEERIAITPMADGLRLAGTVEFAGLEAPPNLERPRMMFRQARRILPGLQDNASTRWMGFRPSMPDSLPVIGLSPRHRNVWHAFGHGHIGLTTGPITGKLVADLVAGRKPPFDLTPFRIDRF